MANPYELDIELQEYHPLQAPPAVGEERYELLPGEVNDIVGQHNKLQGVTNPLWEQDYVGLRCWFPDGGGVPVNYYADPEATPEQLGASSPVRNPYWIQFGGSRAYERSFGNGALKTFTLAHPKAHVSNVVVIDMASNKPIAIPTDWLTTPGQVIVGPFATTPSTNRYKLIVEGSS